MIETNKFTRREFMKRTAAAGAGLALLSKFAVPSAQAAYANTKQLSMWTQSMRFFGSDIPFVSGVPDPAFPYTNFYEVEVNEFTDQLHPQLGPTLLWGYKDKNSAAPQKHLGGVIVAQRGIASRIRFTNNLPSAHILPVDPTIMSAGVGLGQNRIAVHLHGGYIPWTCDGGPFDWFAPGGAAGASFQNGPGSLFDNLPIPMVPGQADYFYNNDQSTRLLWYHDHAYGLTRLNAYAGVASGYLLLDPAYEALKINPGMVPGIGSAIPVVFQDKMFVWGDPALATGTFAVDPTWASVAPLKSQAEGSLWYAHIYDPRLYRTFKGQSTITAPDPSCVAEFFGDTMLANGLVYPVCNVEAKRYRFMFLNACNARFLNFNVFEVPKGTAQVTTNPKTGFAIAGTLPGPKMIQIANEAGYLVTEKLLSSTGIPVNPATFTGNLLLGPAERADVIIDFTGMEGKEFIIYNDAPGPFPGGAPTNDYYLGNPKNPVQPLANTGPDTRNILKIVVSATTPAIPDVQPPGQVLKPAVDLDPPLLVPYTTTTAPIPPLPIPNGVQVLQKTLNEDFDNYGRLVQKIGTHIPQPARVGQGFGMDYLQPPTEVAGPGEVQVWQVFNNTADTHPMHFHVVNVQVLSRQPFIISNGVFSLTGAARGPETDELGWKETVRMNPGECTTVVMKFDLPESPFAVPPSDRLATLQTPITGNEYVWHCHILEHEEHDMMRPVVVTGTPPVDSSLAGVPYTATIAAATGGTATYKIINAAAGPIKVTSTDKKLKITVSGTSFSVTVPAKYRAKGLVTFTITDSSGAIATVTLNIV